MELLVGMKEMKAVEEKEQISINPAEESQEVPDEKLDCEKIFVDTPTPTTTPSRKAKGKPRGVSSKTDVELAEHLRKMREKAVVAKKAIAEERKKKIEELNELKLSKKLNIPVETLAEYEHIRKTSGDKVKLESSKNQTEKKETLDYDMIVNKLFERIKTAKDLEEKAKAERLQLEAARQKQAALEQQRNKAYFTSLGNGKIPAMATQDPWLALFRRPK